MRRYLAAVTLVLGLIAMQGRAQTPNVTLMGTIRGANGLPAKNTLLNFTPSQPFYVVAAGAPAPFGVNKIIPGTNVTCSPFLNGACIGDVTVNASGGGGGGCDSICVLLNPTLTQMIAGAQGKSFGAGATNWGGDLTSTNSPSGINFPCNMYANPTWSFNLPIWTCLHSDIYNNSPGFSLGNFMNGFSNLWYVYTDNSTFSNSSSAGIHNSTDLEMHSYGIGDINANNIVINAKGGATAASDEGIFPNRTNLFEAAEMTGTIATGGGGQGSTVLTMHCSSNCSVVGVGEPLIDMTGGVADTGISNTSPSFPHGIQVLQMTVAGTYATSTCGAVTNDVIVLPQDNNAATVATFAVTTPVDLTPMIGKIFMPLAAASDPERIISVGTYSGGSQTITVPLRYPLQNATPFCAGGMAGSWLLRTQDIVNGHHYFMQVYGSPTANTLYVGESFAGTIHAFYGVNNSAITIYQGALVVNAINPANNNVTNPAGTATGSWLTVADNNAAFANGDAVLHPNRINSYWTLSGHYVTTSNPFATVNGETTSIRSPLYNSATGYYIESGIANSSYTTHGGTYSPPDGIHMGSQNTSTGVFAHGIIMDYAPEGGHRSGNDTFGAVMRVGKIATGSSRTGYDVLELASNGVASSNLFYNAATNSLDFSAPGGTPSVTIGGSRICTVAGACGLTTLTGDGTATGPGSATLTLATVNGAPGTCGDATHICQITTNAKGLVTGQSSFAVGSGTVSSVSVVSANGVSGTVANATTTPAITLVLGNITPPQVTTSYVLGPSGSPVFIRGGSGSTDDLTVQNIAGTVSNLVVHDSGIVEAPLGLLVAGSPACEQNGTNCPTSVNTVNSIAGAVNIVAGANVTVTPSGSNITIAASGGGGGGVASSGYAFVPVTQTTVSVPDAAVTSTNKIFITADPSLFPGAIGSSCSSLTTYESGAWVSARNPGVGFTVSVAVAAGTSGGGEACYSYMIVN